MTVDVIYRAAFGRIFGGCFSLHIGSEWPRETLFFASRDERELPAGHTMRQDSYSFKRRETADEALQYAIDQLCGWADSPDGGPFLVKLKSDDGRILRCVRGDVGNS